jgi:hypothetical protein
MVSPTSYAWAKILPYGVSVDETFGVPTPGFDDPAGYDTPNAQVVYKDRVLQPEQFVLTWAADFSFADLENKDEETTWVQGNTIYVTVAALPPADIKALANQVAAQEEEINVLKTQVGDLQTQVGDLQTRVTALETAAP